MSNDIYIALEYFFVYAFLGWCVEVIFQAVAKGLIVNRGFLNGPVCPIYGFGVLAIFRMLEAVGDSEAVDVSALQEQNALTVFAFGVVLATLVELIGGWALDKLFHARWWDYSKRPFNFHGYICLEFSLIWGLGILLVVRGVNPSISHGLSLVPENIGWVLIAVFSAVFIADVIVSVMVMVGLNKRMAEIDEMRKRMRVVSNGLSERLGTRALDTAQHIGEGKVQVALAKAEAREQFDQAREEAREQLGQAREEAREQFDQARADLDTHRRQLNEKREALIKKVESSRHFGAGRLLRAFPDMQHHEHPELLEMIKEEIGLSGCQGDGSPDNSDYQGMSRGRFS